MENRGGGMRNCLVYLMTILDGQAGQLKNAPSTLV